MRFIAVHEEDNLLSAILARVPVNRDRIVKGFLDPLALAGCLARLPDLSLEKLELICHGSRNTLFGLGLEELEALITTIALKVSGTGRINLTSCHSGVCDGSVARTMARLTRRTVVGVCGTPFIRSTEESNFGCKQLKSNSGLTCGCHGGSGSNCQREFGPGRILQFSDIRPGIRRVDLSDPSIPSNLRTFVVAVITLTIAQPPASDSPILRDYDLSVEFSQLSLGGPSGTFRFYENGRVLRYEGSGRWWDVKLPPGTAFSQLQSIWEPQILA